MENKRKRWIFLGELSVWVIKAEKMEAMEICDKRI